MKPRRLWTPDSAEATSPAKGDTPRSARWRRELPDASMHSSTRPPPFRHGGAAEQRRSTSEARATPPAHYLASRWHSSYSPAPGGLRAATTTAFTDYSGGSSPNGHRGHMASSRDRRHPLPDLGLARKRITRRSHLDALFGRECFLQRTDLGRRLRRQIPHPAGRTKASTRSSSYVKKPREPTSLSGTPGARSTASRVHGAAGSSHPGEGRRAGKLPTDVWCTPIVIQPTVGAKERATPSRKPLAFAPHPRRASRARVDLGWPSTRFRHVAPDVTDALREAPTSNRTVLRMPGARAAKISRKHRRERPSRCGD